jgi:transketolase
MPATTTTDPAQLEDLAVTTIRVLCMDAVEKAASGHPGMPMGCADFAYVLFTRCLKFNPRNPDWPDRDRFVLSAGHGSMLLYTMLHLTGYDLPLAELQRFRQWESMTPGHPEHGEAPGVETTTGPLGQGFANGVGMALAERLLAARYNLPDHKLVDHHTYGIVSDGDLMEGVSHEAAAIAGHLKLGKLIYFYDDNQITIEGATSLAFSEDVAKRFEAYGWHVERIDGQDRTAIARALDAARAETRRPSLILGKTTIGYGSPNKAGSHEVHGAPLGAEECEATRRRFGWTLPPFTVPEEVRPLFRRPGVAGAAKNAEWERMLASYAKKDPERFRLWERTQARKLPEGWRAKLPVFPSQEGAIATRAASGKVINALAPVLPELIGGSADLAPSNNTMVKGQASVSAENMAGRNLHFGVREHGMGGILNGLSLHRGIRPYGGTFLVFSDYMRPSVRLAALMHEPVIYVWTHDSIFLGEDGPTHQPIEHLAALRAMPRLWVFRPADANETAAAWALALERTDGPSALLLTRQNLPIYDDTGLGKGAERGAYVLDREEGGRPDLVLLASGSEVATIRGAAKLLRAQGRKVRTVSMPCWELFEAQDKAYRDSVLPQVCLARLAVEAASPFGWERYVGAKGRVHGLDRFGASAPAKVLAEKLGFTPEAVAREATELLGG